MDRALEAQREAAASKADALRDAANLKIEARADEARRIAAEAAEARAARAAEVAEVRAERVLERNAAASREATLIALGSRAIDSIANVGAQLALARVQADAAAAARAHDMQMRLLDIEEKKIALEAKKLEK